MEGENQGAGPEYDLFVSYAHEDVGVVRTLVERLRADGFRVWFDETNMPVGGHVASRLDTAIGVCRQALVCLSDAYCTKDYSLFELQLIFAKDPAKRRQFAIPVMMASLTAPVPAEIKPIPWADLTNHLTYEAEYRRLKSAVLPTSRSQPRFASPEEVDAIRQLDPVQALVAMVRSARDLYTFVCSREIPGAVPSDQKDLVSKLLNCPRLPAEVVVHIHTIEAYAGLIFRHASSSASIEPGLLALRALSAWAGQHYNIVPAKEDPFVAFWRQLTGGVSHVDIPYQQADGRRRFTSVGALYRGLKYDDQSSADLLVVPVDATHRQAFTHEVERCRGLRENAPLDVLFFRQFDAGSLGGWALVALGRADGCSPEQVLTRFNRLPAALAAALGRQILRAYVLSTEHSPALAYSFFLPHNLLLDRSGAVRLVWNWDREDSGQEVQHEASLVKREAFWFCSPAESAVATSTRRSWELVHSLVTNLLRTCPEGTMPAAWTQANSIEQTLRLLDAIARPAADDQDIVRAVVECVIENKDLPPWLTSPVEEPMNPESASIISLEPKHPELPVEQSMRSPLHLDHSVQFTVYRPNAVRPDRWYHLLVFAHLSELPPGASPEDADPIREVERQARQVLGAQTLDFQNVTRDSQAAVPHEGELTIVPEADGVDFNPPHRSFYWEEHVHREEFRLRAGRQLEGRTVIGQVSVFLGSILLAAVPLSIRVGSAHPQSDEAIAVRARPYRKIFPSYSHKDRDIVDQFQSYAAALGDQYLRDVTHLRAGETWSQQLEGLIREADVFQLFWSSNSMRSHFVRQEWEYALSLARGFFVRPTYWEEPLPSAPREGLPPLELLKLHFQQVHLRGPEPIARSTRSSATPVPAPTPAPHETPSPQHPASPNPPARSFRLRLRMNCRGCRGAWPLGDAHLVLWEEDQTLAIYAVEDGSRVWSDASPFRVRRVSPGPWGTLCLGDWDGELRWFRRNGKMGSPFKAGWTIGDIRPYGEKWLAGTWNGRLWLADGRDTVTEIHPPIADGVSRIAVASTESFAVLSLNGAVSLFQGAQLTRRTGPIPDATDLAYADRELVVLAGERLVRVANTGHVSRPDRLPGRGALRLLVCPPDRRCVLANERGQSWVIDQAGTYPRGPWLPRGDQSLAFGAGFRRFTAASPAGGGVYWREDRRIAAWAEALSVAISVDGQRVVVVLPDAVEVYADPV